MYLEKKYYRIALVYEQKKNPTLVFFLPPVYFLWKYVCLEKAVSSIKQLPLSKRKFPFSKFTFNFTFGWKKLEWSLCMTYCYRVHQEMFSFPAFHVNFISVAPRFFFFFFKFRFWVEKSFFKREEWRFFYVFGKFFFFIKFLCMLKFFERSKC